MDRNDDRARSVEAGTVVAAVGAIVLLVGLFLDWYTPGDGFGGDGASAWTVFEIVDLLLAALAFSVLLAVVSAVVPRASLPTFPRATMAIAGALALVLMIASLIDDPPAARGAELGEGIWISLAGAALIAIGAILERSRIRLVVTPRDREYAERGEADDEETEVVEVYEHPAEGETREFPRG